MRIWNNPTGVARALTGDHVIRYGVNGQADLSGILLDGKRLEVEVKTDTGKQRQEQWLFQRMISKYNGIYIIARSADDAEKQLAALGYPPNANTRTPPDEAEGSSW